jgi:hypothetical protein
LLREASLKTETREVPARRVVELPSTTVKSTDKPATAAKSVTTKSVEKPGLAAAHSMANKGSADKAPKQPAAAPKPPTKKSVDKPVIASTKPVTKPVRLAKVDPLAPLAARHSGNPKDSTADR